MPSEPPTFRSQYLFAFSILSGLVSAMSLISLIIKYFDVGLAPIAAQLVQFYRDVVAFFLDPILAYVPFRIPAWYRDTFVISLMLLALNLRSQSYISNTYGIPYADTTRVTLFRSVLKFARSISLFLIAAFSLYGLLLPPMLIIHFFKIRSQERRLFANALANRDPSKPKPKIVNTRLEALRYYFTSMTATIVASIVFFGLNAL